MASPRTNLAAPSMAPKNALSASSTRRRSRAVASSIRPGRQVGVDRHLLAGHGVEREAGGDLGDAARALGDHDEVHDHQDAEHDHADDDVALHDEAAERLDHVPGGVGPPMALAQDQPGRGEVQRQPQHGGDQEHGREGAELERPLDEQRGQQDQDRRA